MRYPENIPAASPDDLVAAIATEDPIQTMQERIDELSALGALIDAEKAKWQQAQGAFGLFRVGAAVMKAETESPIEHGQPNGTVDLAVDIGEVVTASESSASVKISVPAHRREALIGLFRSQPNRVWRTRELAAQLQELEPDAGDLTNLVSRALSALQADGLVTKLKKGSYRWATHQPVHYPAAQEQWNRDEQPVWKGLGS
jgi:hypothetical protein